MSAKITIVFLALLLSYFIYGWYKTFKLHLKLQQLAQSFPADFRLFVEEEEGWSTYDRGYNKKDGIKIIPNPHVTSEDYYYIKFSGPIDEDLAIKFLIKNFSRYMRERGKI